MSGLALDGSNPDVSLLYDINGLAKDAPHWFDRVMEFVGEYGIVIGLVLVGLGAWWSVRKRGQDAPSAVAGLMWAPLAAGIALIANIPIREFVQRPRPFKDHQLEVLVAGKTDFSFVSDHATLTMGLAVGVFMAHRRYGLAAIGLALLEGFCRVYMGVHYPTDVIGGFALGTAVALLLAPLAMMLLTPLTTTIAGSRAGWLIRAGGPAPAAAAGEGFPEFPEAGTRSPGTGRGSKDLAA
ncbi:phosphatase PAP2 family protein [Streptomyces sp. NPDC021098]|uniref:phosphatase PAP2 family protein n=1 Tax=unclassified Streptomyces TaxID=2593676 RepID=UPI0037BDD07A